LTPQSTGGRLVSCDFAPSGHAKPPTRHANPGRVPVSVNAAGFDLGECRALADRRIKKGALESTPFFVRSDDEIYRMMISTRRF
jgi:hypothetical protein